MNHLGAALWCYFRGEGKAVGNPVLTGSETGIDHPYPVAVLSRIVRVPGRQHTQALPCAFSISEALHSSIWSGVLQQKPDTPFQSIFLSRKTFPCYLLPFCRPAKEIRPRQMHLQLYADHLCRRRLGSH